jgi:deoxyribonuclease V
MDLYKVIIGLINQIPRGRVTSYTELAGALGDRTVAKAIRRVIRDEIGWEEAPCYKVIEAEGFIGKKGFEERVRLLKSEGVGIDNSMVKDFERVVFREFKSTKPLHKLRSEQMKIASRANLVDSFSEVNTVAGVDVSYGTREGYGAIATIRYKSKELVEIKKAKGLVKFPYLPTYLSYREFPLVKKLISQLEELPTILLIDGNGVLHPYRAGLATHAGAVLNLPTIGVAKSLLCGEIEKIPARISGHSAIKMNGKVIGYAIKTSKGKPIFISPGNNISMSAALKVVKNLSWDSRLPIPLRVAHQHARNFLMQKLIGIEL